MAGHDSPTTLEHEPGPPVQGSLRRRRPQWSAVVIGLVVVLSLAAYATGSWPSWLSPFQQATVDRSSTPLFLQLQNVAQFRAATGTFQVLVDVERDTTDVPSVISGERTTLFATGTVDAAVDFGGLGADRVTSSADRRTVTISLPPRHSPPPSSIRPAAESSAINAASCNGSGTPSATPPPTTTSSTHWPARSSTQQQHRAT